MTPTTVTDPAATLGWRASAVSALSASVATVAVLTIMYLWNDSYFHAADERTGYLPGIAWVVCFTVVLAAGTTMLALRLEMPVGWATLAGFAVATSGWTLFWLAANRPAGLVSLAWLPWLWWSWAGVTSAGVVAGRVRARARALVGVAAFGYLAVAAGWPSTWLASLVLVAGVVTETLVRTVPGSRSRLLLAPLVTWIVALSAGLVSVALWRLPIYEGDAGQVSVFAGGVANRNVVIPNLWDVVAFAAPQVSEGASVIGGPASAAPVCFAGWFAVVVLWSVGWEGSLWRRPGMVTSVVGTATLVLFTQAPSVLGPLREPIRQLGGAQFFFVIGVCILAGSGGWVVTRNRLAGMALTFVAMGWISWSRGPRAPDSVVGILLVMAAAGLVVLVAVRSERLLALTALVATLGLTLVAFGFQQANDNKRALGSERPDVVEISWVVPGWTAARNHE